eukprot:TRINITY_DN12518_c0_g1_i1.p2 TRINITY_DN12518_c0_g1~~TRINITY_DN12518_c0_g1_i1.p2  ORF type:complete len:111 (-),score=1.55 TRINITY_DN12518_c0_g1_i1:119-451(-)
MFVKSNVHRTDPTSYVHCRSIQHRPLFAHTHCPPLYVFAYCWLARIPRSHSALFIRSCCSLCRSLCLGLVRSAIARALRSPLSLCFSSSSCLARASACSLAALRLSLIHI